MRPWRTAWHLAGLRECSESRYSLSRCHTIAERSELLSVREPVLRVGDPSLAQAHQPFHERRSGSGSALVQDRRGWSGPAGDALPSGDGSGAASPASKNSSISANAASGECWRPRRVTRWAPRDRSGRHGRDPRKRPRRVAAPIRPRMMSTTPRAKMSTTSPKREGEAPFATCNRLDFRIRSE